MKRMTLSCVAVLAGAAALVGLGPVGLADAEGLPGSSAQDSTIRVSLNFHAGDGITLKYPTATWKDDVWNFQRLFYEGGDGAGFSYNAHSSPDTGWGGMAGSKMSWPIRQYGVETGYTVTARVGEGYSGDFPWEPGCVITDANNRQTGPYHCTMAERSLDNDYDLHITDDRVNRWAEASGSITTTGNVSLQTPPDEDAAFTTESQRKVFGTATVDAVAPTEFDAVLVEGEDTSEPNTARMSFKYALLDNGKPVTSSINGKPLYVEGEVWNYRGGMAFKGDSSCRFASQDGVVDGNSGYSCNRSGDFAHTGVGDGHVHYISDFTISKKQ
jgi:hypothetical protein